MIEEPIEPKKNLLWLWIVLAIIIILIIAGSVWATRAGKWNWVKGKLGIKTVETNSSQSVSVGEVALSQTPASDWQTFTNSKYRFSFMFPKDWLNQAFVGKTQDDGTGDSDYVFTTTDLEKIGILTPEKYFADSTIYTGTSFSDWAATNAGNCSADAPCAHASCNNISKKTPFKTVNELSGIKYNVIYKVESCVGGPEKDSSGVACACKKVEREIGPIYELDTLAKSGSTLRLIRIAPNILDNNTLQVSDDIWEKVVNSVKFY